MVFLFVVLMIMLALFVLVVLPVVGVAALTVMIAREVPWLLILVGIWLIVRAKRGPSRHRWHNFRPRPEPAQATRPIIDVEPTAVSQVPPRRELPIDVQVKVDQIRRKSDMLLGYADRFPPFSHDLHIVRQTAAEYLPRTIDAYLALPGDQDPVVSPGGKTALEELREQLQLLDSKLDEIAQDMQRQDLDRLLANRLFLEARFRSRDLEPASGPARQEPDAA